MSNPTTIALCGNPNSGKTTTFNLLTGSRHQVGNWPGVTVEKKVGQLRLSKQQKQKFDENNSGSQIDVVDLPGTYSLDAIDESIALDEKIARNYILSGEADLIVNIIDASNIERNLYLTTQLLEIGKPMLVILNMMDVAKKNNIVIDIDKLSNELNCPVIPLIASDKKLPEAFADALTNFSTREFGESQFSLQFESPLQELYKAMLELLAKSANNKERLEWQAVRLLEDHHFSIETHQSDEIKKLQKRGAEVYGEDIDIVIAEARYS